MSPRPTRVTLSSGSVAYIAEDPARVEDLIRIARRKGRDRVCLSGSWIRLDQITAVLAPGESDDQRSRHD